MKNTKYIEQIRTRLENYLENPGNGMDKISANAAARGMGVSNSRLSQFLNEKYTGDNFALAKEVDGWLQRQQERQNYDEIFTETLETRAVRKICQVARMCHIEREMGVATGGAGVGKSRGCEVYARDNNDVIHIEVNITYTTKSLMRSICSKLGLSDEGQLYDMFNEAVVRLKDSGRLLLIDEAERLPYNGLELLRDIYEAAGVGVLLVGMPRLISMMRGKKGEYEQLYSRVGIHATIPTMKEYPEDVEALIKSVLPNSNGVWKAFHEITHNGRRIEKLLKRSMQVAERNGTDITAEVVKASKEYIII